MIPPHLKVEQKIILTNLKRGLCKRIMRMLFENTSYLMILDNELWSH